MRRILVSLMVALVLACGALGQKTPAAARSCESLAQLDLPGGKIISARMIEAGTFIPPTGMTPRPMEDPTFYKTLASFCRMVVAAKPSADSDIKIEVWMPINSENTSGNGGWNGRFQGQGNGGFAGEIDYRGMAMALHRGYATAGTDTGHAGEATDARWALGHPEKITDFGYRGIHEMTRIAKAAIQAFYGGAPQHSYFGSCSNGGRQALMEAQRFPEDYDGILAGAPANFWTHLLTSALWNAQAVTEKEGSYIPSGKLAAIARAVNASCDGQDGVTDGVLNDPRQCHFDPAALLCKEDDSDLCLTPAQVAALKKLYQGPRDSTGKEIFPGFLPGAEEGPGGWSLWITGTAPGKSLLFAFGNGFFSNMVYEKADWNYKEVELDKAVKMADEKYTRDLNATDPNLKAFKARGGKLILYHGWNDAAISALNTINYYNSVASSLGRQQTEAFVRLYMVPGMQHCSGGPGTDSFGQPGARDQKDAQHSVQRSLELWVEKRSAPSEIIATKYIGEGATKEVKMTRPLCPYPQAAKYKGNGDANDAGNFICAPGDH